MFTPDTQAQTFLFLQGPHGPFFAGLSRMLRRAGARTWRVGFNAGDQAFSRPRDGFIPYLGTVEHWPARFRELVRAKKITDIVLYGDTRPIHASAIAIARDLGLRIHVFEEGYLRPYWVTYERGGANGHSRLMDLTVDEMRAALPEPVEAPSMPPATWGDMREHIFYGALYHGFVLFANGRYRNFRPHRALNVRREFLLYLKKLVLMPALALGRMIASTRIRYGGFPYHLALLQLEHDSAFQAHSDFDSMADFVACVVAGFARGAPADHHLVFKAHPLEDGRVPLRRLIRRAARANGIGGRVHFLRGGKLAGLLDRCLSVVTVNSTAAQQALWRGLPLKAFGTAVYSKPEFVSDLPLPEFFASPPAPDMQAYQIFRHYLLQTSQIPGGFYSARGRRELMGQVVDRMLSARDVYVTPPRTTEAVPQQLCLVN